VFGPCNGLLAPLDSGYVPISYEHPSVQGQLRRLEAVRGARTDAAEPAAIYMPVSRHSARACCCSAKPVVIVVVPAANERPAPTELLLCGHHYRISRTALVASGLLLLDIEGLPLAADAWPGAAY
jgi:hypothetical protein